MKTITIKGNVPSKKNNKRPFIRNGRIMLFPSKNYTSWHSDALCQLTECAVTKENLREVHNLTITFYAPNRRKYDLTNKAESIMDLLVDYGLLEDDNYEVVPELTLRSGGVDRENPRVEIEYAGV